MNSLAVRFQRTLDKLHTVSSLKTSHYEETYIYVLLLHDTGFEQVLVSIFLKMEPYYAFSGSYSLPPSLSLELLAYVRSNNDC